jgi:hypothetical protein
VLAAALRVSCVHCPLRSLTLIPRCVLSCLEYAIRGPVEAQTKLPKKASMHASRMHDVEIDRYPTISTSACVRNRRPRRTRPRSERRLACRACESGAAPSDSAEIRCRAARSYGPRPHGFYGRHRGRHRHVVYELAIAQKADFRPERRLRLRLRDVHRRSNPRSDAERHARALPAHHARSARPPLGIGVARSHRRGGGSNCVRV